MGDGSQETAKLSLKDRYPEMFQKVVDITYGLYPLFPTGKDLLTFYVQYAEERPGQSVSFPIVKTKKGEIFMLGAGHSQRRVEDLLSAMEISQNDISVSCVLTGLVFPPKDVSSHKNRLVNPFIIITDADSKPKAFIPIQTGEPEEGRYIPRKEDYDLYKQIFAKMNDVIQPNDYRPQQT